MQSSNAAYTNYLSICVFSILCPHCGVEIDEIDNIMFNRLLSNIVCFTQLTAVLEHKHR